ncbi:unnamed protein product [Prorocentrum cordatum]|uniref:RING-type domain-containing protein n=1 Tax=Prorocentrum cordatum TaxID=2364126 RepID=A0ABN9T986_9DINO|nr:unnamed protein product [Polarella glacialis]
MEDGISDLEIDRGVLRCLPNRCRHGRLQRPQLALCGACSQPLHGVCMRAAAAVDSRCPLCRAELGSVGYAVGGVTSRPPRSRFRGSDQDIPPGHSAASGTSCWTCRAWAGG